MRQLFNKSPKGVILILCFVLMLSTVGCGQQDERGTVSASGESASGETASNESASHESEGNTTISTDWKTKGFSIKDYYGGPSASEEVSLFQEIRGSVFKETEPEFEYTEKRSVVDYLRDTCYVLYSYKQQQGQRFVLEKRRSDIEKPDQLELFSESGQVPVGYAACMDVITESDIAVLFVSLKDNWKGDVKEYLLLHLDGEGNIISQTELLDAYQEKGIERYDLAQGLWQCDGQGYSYVLTNEGKTLTVFDAEGGFVMCQDFSGEEGVNVETAFHAPDGSLIFPLNDPGQSNTRLVWLDTEKKQYKELATINVPYLKQFTMLENGQIYYSEGSSLVKWDIQTGKQERVFSYLAADIPYDMFEYVKHVSVTEQGEFILYIARRDRMDISVLSDKPQETEGITIVDFCGMPYVQSCALGYNKDHNDIRIQYKISSGDKETLWTRTMAELAAGKGPDMLCLWAGDEYLRILYEKGVLADLTELVPEEVLNQIFPGILESGSVDGNLVGLGLSGMPQALVTSNKLWQQDQWSVEDILDIVEAHPDLEGIFIVDDWGSLKRSQSSQANLDFMSQHYMENSPFLDLKKGESHFEDMRFQKILDLAKTYGEMPVPSGDISAMIKEGKYIAAYKYLLDPYDVVQAMEKYGEECHFIGYPGQTGYSGCWSSVNLIVVNKKSKYAENIAEFLQYLLDVENQQTIPQKSGATGVREDVTRQSVYWSEWSGEWYFKRGGGGSYDFTKPNGESYIEDYVEFLRKLGPWGSSHAVISDIVSEEAEDYFNGVKSAEQVAEIIDNRVQLYLDE